MRIPAPLRRSTRLLATLSTFAAVTAITASCGGKKSADPAATAGAPLAAANVERPRATVEVPSAAKVENHLKSASAEAARHFTAWTPVHAFLSAPVMDGRILGPKEAIVVTRDNHVGVTTDGGVSWNFVRHTSSAVYAVAGAPGGPYAAAGAGGYLSVSKDGREWTELPRYVNEPLVAVAVGPLGIAAAGNKGAFVRTSPTGADTVASTLPPKFKLSELFIDAKQFIVMGGKSGAFVSTDGKVWTPVNVQTPVAQNLSSRGVCALGKVGPKGKSRGVVCSVNGAAYGLSPTETMVIGKSDVALSRDGGATWAMAPMPLKGARGVAGKPGGPYHLYDAKGAFMSTVDGRTWTPGVDPSAIQGAPPWPAKLAPCGGRLPMLAEACNLTRQVTSPETLPDVRGFRFLGDAGIAWGDSALVAMTADGGATWKAASGYPLGRMQGFDARGQRIVVAGSSRAVASTDGGKGFRPIDLPPKTPAIDTVHIADDGRIYLAGRDGLILQSEGDLASWTRLDTGPKNKTEYLVIHEVAGALYAAGARGELHRSEDAGKTWTPIATGLPDVVLKMAGQGKTVLAVTGGGRWSPSRLLRSEDGGLHFFVQRELSESTPRDFAFKDGVIRYNNLVSTDFGAIWTRASDWYVSGGTDIADGSGTRIENLSGYGSGKDRFMVIGRDRDDVTIVDSFFNKGARFVCDAGSGCWMIAAGQVYRPAQ